METQDVALRRAPAAELTVSRRRSAAAAFTAWRPSLVAGTIAFVIFRVGAEIAALISVYGGNTLNAVQRSPSVLQDIWFRWDAGWYLSIIEAGYVHQSHVPVHGGFQDATAFAPLYPALGRAAVDVLHVSPRTAATIVSAAALLVALVLLHRLGRLELGGRGGEFVLLAVLAYPFSFFLAAPYAESLLLAAVAGSLLAARTRHWVLAGVLAGVAALSKTYMVVLAVPLAVEYMSQREWQWHRVRADAVAVVAGPLMAVGALMAYMQYRFADPIRFLHAEADWQHQLSGPWVAVSATLADITARTTPVDSRVIDVIYLVCIPLLLGSAVYAWLRWRRSYAAFMAIAAVVFVTDGTMRSTNRYVLTVVPLFILAAMLLRKHRWVFSVLSVLASLAGLYFLHEFVGNQFVG